jgi:hypothetical protein
MLLSARVRTPPDTMPSSPGLIPDRPKWHSLPLRSESAPRPPAGRAGFGTGIAAAASGTRAYSSGVCLISMTIQEILRPSSDSHESSPQLPRVFRRTAAHASGQSAGQLISQHTINHDAARRWASLQGLPRQRSLRATSSGNQF